jgi:3-oxoacyl-[acyl-carrier-protein] synthase III
MKPFVINRQGRLVLPFNFFPELDLSVFETLEQFSAVIQRDFQEKAPTEADIMARIGGAVHTRRYDLLRDLALISSG